MVKHYRDYIWEEGKPLGISPIAAPEEQELSYKIVADPYNKWISIEKYEGTEWTGTAYDSKLFDFRSLKQTNQTAWTKTAIQEKDRYLIRDENDRIICIEEYVFKENLCVLCRAYSVHGIPLSLQQMLYTALGDPFNGVVLFDANGHRVMNKMYEIDRETGEFAQLLQENWKECNLTRNASYPGFQRGADTRVV